MGLPYWRNYDDPKPAKATVKTDPTAAARSSIRRRPSIHRGAFPRPPRWQSLLDPARGTPGSPPPPPNMSSPPPLPVPDPPAQRLNETLRIAAARARERDMAVLREYRVSARALAEASQREGRTFLPTPPLEYSEQEAVEERDGGPVPAITVQPVDGLGDRVTSPSPTPRQEDAWQVMRESMRADRHLPSADSSFTSAAAAAATTTTTGSSFVTDATDLTDPEPTAAPDPLARPNEANPPRDPDVDCVDDGDHSSAEMALAVSSRGDLSNPHLPGAAHPEFYAQMHDFQGRMHGALVLHDAEIMNLHRDFHALRRQLELLGPSVTPLVPQRTLSRDQPSRPQPHTNNNDHNNHNNTIPPLVRVPSLRREEARVTPDAAQADNDVRSTDDIDVPFPQQQSSHGTTAASPSTTTTITSSSVHATETPAVDTMDRILHRLARREDVPDAMWAAAGLDSGRDLSTAAAAVAGGPGGANRERAGTLDGGWSTYLEGLVGTRRAMAVAVEDMSSSSSSSAAAAGTERVVEEDGRRRMRAAAGVGRRARITSQL